MSGAEPFTDEELAIARDAIRKGLSVWATPDDLRRLLATIDAERTRREAAEAVLLELPEWVSCSALMVANWTQELVRCHRCAACSYLDAAEAALGREER